MFLVKLLVAIGIICGLIYGLNRYRNELLGRKSGGLVVAGMKKARRDGPNEMEKFMANYRAQTARAALAVADPAPEHTLGIDISNPALRPAAEGPRRLLFLLLKTTLADHYLFHNARLADFLDGLPAQELAQRVDFLICVRDFQPVVLTDIADERNAAQIERRTELFAKLGVRYVSIAPGALPKPHQIRAAILGTANAATG
ncbi:MAG: hypothetical protein EXR36_05100 [Betaproteobacteria bacterium]|nr:hypothetical protein [Betaproteobacteria bacterium]